METLTDIQNQPDSRNLAIDRVGVKDLKYPIQLRDKAHAEQSTVATVSMAVDLPKEYKGTHMSRFVEVLNSHGPVLDVHSIIEPCRVNCLTAWTPNALTWSFVFRFS